MRYIVTAMLVCAMIAFIIAPGQAFAQGDTLVIYASNPKTLDQVINGDTLGNGAKAHHFYKLVSVDTTYIFDATVTTNENITVWGIPHPSTGKLPCIQPDVLLDNSIPGLLFTLTGHKTTGRFKNLYLLGIAINNSVNFGSGQAIQLSADSIRLEADNVVFEQWSQFAIGYAGNWDKFFITNCKFRNMTTLPNQWYVGELLRNQNYIGAFKTDTIMIKYNTMLCVSGYATAATSGIVSYYEFSHNNIIYTFKNPFFLDRMVNAKFNNNIFYGVYAGGQNKTEYNGGWDSFTAQTVASIITMGPLDSTTAALLLGHASTGAGDTAAEKLRNVEVKNNTYFWPSGLTSFWTSWNDTAHVDSIYEPVFMNGQSVNMFTDKAKWPGFQESGNRNADPGFGATIPGALNSAGGANGVGLLNWFTVVRRGTGTTETYGYNITQVPVGLWTPPWPLPEATDMQYSNNVVKNSSTDGRPLGDPYWFNGLTSVREMPLAIPPSNFELSAAYPNPFNPSVNIQYTLNTSGITSLKVYNVLGQLLKTVVDNLNQRAAKYTVNVDMSGYNSGVYLYVLTHGNNRLAQKMILSK
ncbi:MAG: T9SS type A sorting domain-containing protein [Ignavibacteria bacterium]|nr:MAG: T9SS type A sorting domain-containing protein [Ignavibacteria bacterium]